MKSSEVLLGVVMSFIKPSASQTPCCCLSPCPVHMHAPTPTLAAVFLVAVVHAVEDVVAAPAARDAVRPVQAEELVLPALFHAADLWGQEAAGVRAFRRVHRSSAGTFSEV